MPQKSPIEWTDYTSNPIYAVNNENGKRGWFCEIVSAGCGHCYSQSLNTGRFGNGLKFIPTNAEKVEFVLNEKELEAIIRLDRSLGKKKERTKLFICDMTDLFLEHHPDEFIDKILGVAVFCPNIDFQILTKRPDRMMSHLKDKEPAKEIMEYVINLLRTILEPDELFATMDKLHAWSYSGKPPVNIWLGVSVEDQKAANERIPLLLETPAAIRFLSVEPLLGPVDFVKSVGSTVPIGKTFTTAQHIDWVIVGGESGPHARPMHPDWVRSIRDQCQAAGVPFFFKQWGEWQPSDIKCIPGEHTGGGIYLWPTGYWGNQGDFWRGAATAMDRVGKKAAGRELEGRTWDEFPGVSR